MLDNAKIGQKVYVIYYDWCASATVKGIGKSSQGEDYYLWDGGYRLDINGNETDEREYGTAGSSFANTFATGLEAVTALKERNEKAFNDYCNQLNTAEDFIRFAINNCINGDEYTDWNARRAYEKRAKDIFGIDLRY